MFMVQHDCGHHSFFKNAAVNDVYGSFFESSPPARHDRHLVHRLAGKDFASWTEDERMAAENVGRVFNRIGFLVRNGYLDSREFVDRVIDGALITLNEWRQSSAAEPSPAATR